MSRTLIAEQIWDRAGIYLVKRAAVLAGIIAALLVLSGGIGPRSSLDAGPPGADDKSEAKQVRTYDADAGHIWNRLHSALFVRATSEGVNYGQDELDPLLWPESRFLLVGEHHKHVVALLDEFLAKDGDKLIKDPLKRAVFQHDLWAIFDWLAHPGVVYGSRSDECTPEQRALQIRLAKIILRLALSAEQIQQLPDNYARAIASKVFSTSHNPDKPDTVFLPPELFKSDGPWVQLGRQGGKSAAPVHLQFVQGRSAFFVFMNLPGGRKATLAYLERLRDFGDPLMPKPLDRKSRAAKHLPRFNPELPQFPVGTQVALAREMMLIDNKGKITPTRLIESVQFRVYREIPKIDPKRSDSDEGKQYFYELRMSRKDLFSADSHGLRVVGPQEKDISPSIIPSNHDEFEGPPSRREGLPIMQACSGCHGHRQGPGILSVGAYLNNFLIHPASSMFGDSERLYLETVAMSHKWETYSWGLLQGLLERESK